jgi:multidrug efflux pump subunit AcrB
LKKLIAYFIKYPVSVNTLLAGIVLLGLVGYRSINASFFPLIPNRIIQIQLIYPGASPEEMEEGVVSLIEEKLEGISGVERITSTSLENNANILVEIEKGYNRQTALEDVKNGVNAINSFPTGLEKPVVFLRENINFTINYALVGKNIDLHTLKDYGREIERDLLRTDGISKVDLKGFPEEEIEVAFDEEALQAYELTFEQAANAIRSSNLDITGGVLKMSTEEFSIRSRNKEYYGRELENLVVKATADGKLVRLKDVASINDQWADDPNRIWVNGKPGVEVLVNSTDQQDLIENAEYVTRYFEQFNKDHSSIEAILIRDQSKTLVERKNLLMENGAIGMVLVLLLLSMFLNPRVAFWVAVGLPISFLGMFFVGYIYGMTINVISLFGMIVVIGILVDDGIVISENIYSHFEKGKSAIRAAIDGTMEVLPAVFSAVLTTMVAFSFFFMVDGRAGDFFSELAFVVIATLAVSLIEALIILPSHLAHSKALKEAGKRNWVERKTDKAMYWMRDRFYAPILRFCLNHRFVAVAAAIALLLVSIGGIRGGIVKTTFFPFIERNNVPVELSLPSGTREFITLDKLIKIEKAAWNINDRYRQELGFDFDVIQNIERTLGPRINEGNLNLILVESEQRVGLSSNKIASDLRKEVGPLPEAEKLTYGNASPFGKPVSVTILGTNSEEMSKAKMEIRTAMQGLDQLKDVVVSQLDGVKEINLQLKDKAYLLGLNEALILNQIRQGYFGYEVQRLQRGKDEVKVWVRYSEDQRSSINKLEDMRIRTPQGLSIPLSQLVNYTIERGVVSIDRLDGMKQITVEAELSDNKISAIEVISDLKENIVPNILAKYPTVDAIYEGQNREAAKTANSAKTALPLVLLLILAIITFTFRSLGQAIIILLLLVPFSLIGVIWGHAIHGHQMSILSFLGIVALIGIIVNDSLVLVSKMNGFLKEGRSFKEAVYEAGYTRFRAIFLTSMTTIAGLAPLILEKSFQAQFLIPMAISVAYGIGIATILTLILLPVFLSLWNDIKRGTYYSWNLKPISPEDVEPAIKELEAEREDYES